jgi:hypothetical protein
VVAGGVDPAGKRAHVVDTGRLWQKSKHESSLPMTSGSARTVRWWGAILHLNPPT